MHPQHRTLVTLHLYRLQRHADAAYLIHYMPTPATGSTASCEVLGVIYSRKVACRPGLSCMTPFPCCLGHPLYLSLCHFCYLQGDCSCKPLSFGAEYCSFNCAGHALWCSLLPSIPLVEPEQVADSSSTNGNGIIAAALEGPLLPNDQQKVNRRQRCPNFLER